jgi:hypothetical protein
MLVHRRQHMLVAIPRRGVPGTGATEQKALNLTGNPHVALTTGCNTWDAGLDVVVQGDAVQVTDDHHHVHTPPVVTRQKPLRCSGIPAVDRDLAGQGRSGAAGGAGRRCPRLTGVAPLSFSPEAAILNLGLIYRFLLGYRTAGMAVGDGVGCHREVR